MSLKKKSLRGGLIALALLLTAPAFELAAPEPALACTPMWGVQFSYYYSNGGYCFEDCSGYRSCSGDTTGEVQVEWGECFYCG